MRKCLVLITVCISSIVSYSQNVGIGTPNPQNKLHVAGGFRLDTLTGVNGAGLLRHDANGVVYGLKFSGNINDVLRGDGSFGSGSAGSVGWLLNGNSGTNPATHFLGTTDNVPLNIRVNNLRSGLIDPTSGNAGWGYQTLLSNTTGARNTAVGNEALSRNVIGKDNTAVGYNALFQNIGQPGTILFTEGLGIQNTAVGSGALYANTEGLRNTATGYNALRSNQIGVYNSAYGAQALLFNTSGFYNSAFGANALASNINGARNSAFGDGALGFNTDGYDNAAFGHSSLTSNNSYYNSAFGSNALHGNTSGVENSAVGYSALWNNTTGSHNNAFGSYALENNIGSGLSCAFGSEALRNSNASYNSAFGASALIANTSGTYNTAMGYLTMAKNTTGYANTGVGAYALGTITTGGFNTAIGYAAGYGDNPHTGGVGLPSNVSNVTCIGYDTGYPTTSSNQVNIGNFSVGWIGGNVGWSTYSDKRMKHDIKEDVPGLAFITRLKPVSYHINLAKEKSIAKANINDMDWDGKYDIEKRKMTGFLAQDVEAAANEVNYNFSGVHKPKNGDGLYSLEYGAFVVPLVKAVQEQQSIIEKQQKLIDELLKRVEALEKK